MINRKKSNLNLLVYKIKTNNYCKNYRKMATLEKEKIWKWKKNNCKCKKNY